MTVGYRGCLDVSVEPNNGLVKAVSPLPDSAEAHSIVS
jgi:hypothetical protein